MMSRARKFSAAYGITSDERGKLAEELMSSIDRDEDDDEEELVWRSRSTSEPPRYGADDDGPVSDDRWGNAPLRIARGS